jgi:hypothetical protein
LQAELRASVFTAIEDKEHGYLLNPIAKKINDNPEGIATLNHLKNKTY